MFPDTREMPEYEDYKAEHSQKNAAEFISQVQENYAYLLDKRENCVSCVANRPGVKKLGEHGLWNADGKVPVLQISKRNISYLILRSDIRIDCVAPLFLKETVFYCFCQFFSDLCP